MWAWWERSYAGPTPGPLQAEWPETPALVSAGTDTAIRAIRDRSKTYTPDWIPRAGDPGVALSQVVATQLSAVAQQVNMLPSKQAGDLLSLGGLSRGGPSIAKTVAELRLDDAAREVTVLDERTAFAGPAVNGTASVFETVRALIARPIKLAAIMVRSGPFVRRIDADEITAGFSAPLFGSPPQPGATVWFGFRSSAPTSSLTGPVALYLSFASDISPSSTSRVDWTIATPTGETTAGLALDDTDGLTRTGIVEIRVPDGWDEIAEQGEVSMRWLVARLVSGSFDEAPVLRALSINAIALETVETRRNEPLEAIVDIAAPPDGAPTYRLTSAPVVPRSVRLRIERSEGADPFAAAAGTSTLEEWSEVDSFGDDAREKRVFRVDAATGELAFPEGGGRFRRVLAEEYRVNSAAPRVAAGTLLSLRSGLPFVLGAALLDEVAATATAEIRETALVKGPGRLRCGGRAVGSADYESAALDAPGGVARAVADPGRDGVGMRRPGWVRVFALPASGEATPSWLDGVAEHLEDRVAPLAVRVVAVGFRRCPVRIDSEVAVRRGVDPSAVRQAIAAALDTYLDPLKFPVGGAVLHRLVLAAMLGIDGVEHADARIIAGGRPRANCEDAGLGEWTLPLRAEHTIVVRTNAVAR